MIVKTKTIFIKDFSIAPAGRIRADGEKTAEHFHEEILVPALLWTEKLTVSFDGVTAFASSFLEEVFGGLVTIYGFDVRYLKKHMILTTSEKDMRDYIRLAWRYIERAN